MGSRARDEGAVRFKTLFVSSPPSRVEKRKEKREHVRIHVDVVRGEVEGDEELEQEGELRVGRGEETEEAGGGAAVRCR